MRPRVTEDLVVRHCEEIRRVHAEIEQTHRQAGSTSLLDDRLRDAVTRARSSGVGWTAIGNALGLRRGRAYARFRIKPDT